MSEAPRIIVISMPDAELRRKAVSGNLGSSAGLQWSFFDGLTEKAAVPGLISNQEMQINSYGRPLTPGEVGCFKSHYVVMKQIAARSDDGWTVVLEDDVFYDVNFEVEEAISFSIRNNIDYMRLFSRMYKPADVVATLNGARQIIRFRTDPYGAQGYLINKRGALRFLRGLDSINLPIDDELGRFWRHGLDAYCVFPYPIVERRVLSSLEEHRVKSTAGRKKNILRLMIFRLTEKMSKTAWNAKYLTGRKRPQ